MLLWYHHILVLKMFLIYTKKVGMKADSIISVIIFLVCGNHTENANVS